MHPKLCRRESGRGRRRCRQSAKLPHNMPFFARFLNTRVVADGDELYTILNTSMQIALTDLSADAYNRHRNLKGSA